MRTRTGVVAMFALVSAMVARPGPAAALQANPSHTHIAHVMTGFPGAPDGAGLLPTAKGEVEIVVQHLGLAARDMSNLEWMQTHAAHVLNALDPSRMAEGPGLGMGVVAASEAIAQHIELAAAAEGASDNVKTHAVHVATAARAVAARATEMADLAERVAAARDYSTAEGLIEQMRRMAGQLTTGVDENGDGQIGWADGEGGLDQVEQHMGFIVAGEGL